MSVPERKLDPSDLTEAELAPQPIPQRRRLFVVEELHDDPVVIVAPPGTDNLELARRVAAALASGPPSQDDDTEAVKSFLHAIWDEDFATKLMERLDWTQHLPEGDRRLFVETVGNELQQSMTSGDLEPFFLLIDRWKSTAEVWADPETLAALTTDPDPNPPIDDLDIDEPDL